jgi:hypothetical protein
VRAYQSLCRLVAHLNPENDLALWEIRQAHYRDWEEKIRHIAREQGYDLPI